MKRSICSFCGKGEESLSYLVHASKDLSSASICNECLEVCSKIQVKSGAEPAADAPADQSISTTTKTSPKTYYRISPQPSEPRRHICSFCGASMRKTRRLISSPVGLPQTYICGECVAAAMQQSNAE